MSTRCIPWGIEPKQHLHHRIFPPLNHDLDLKNISLLFENIFLYRGEYFCVVWKYFSVSRRIFLGCLEIFFCITQNISVLADGARKNVIGVFRPSPVCLLSPQWAPPPPSPLPRSPSHPLPCYLPFLVLPFNLLSQTLIGQCALCFVHNMYFVFSTF